MVVRGTNWAWAALVQPGPFASRSKEPTSVAAFTRMMRGASAPMPLDKKADEITTSRMNAIESGSHREVLHALQLAEWVVDYCNSAPRLSQAGTLSKPVLRERPGATAGPSRLDRDGRLETVLQDVGRRLCYRAPLLVLLLSWFGFGLIGGGLYRIIQIFEPRISGALLVGIAFDLWGIGFLALVALGFYMRVRNVAFGARHTFERSYRAAHVLRHAGKDKNTHVCGPARALTAS